jgi:hypothetical protein
MRILLFAPAPAARAEPEMSATQLEAIAGATLAAKADLRKKSRREKFFIEGVPKVVWRICGIAHKSMFLLRG